MARNLQAVAAIIHAHQSKLRSDVTLANETKNNATFAANLDAVLKQYSVASGDTSDEFWVSAANGAYHFTLSGGAMAFVVEPLGTIIGPSTK